MANRGRPNKFSNSQVALLKSVVKQFGLSGAIPVLAEQGVSVSMTTLSKYVHGGSGGRPPLRLKRGRRPIVSA
ncbi:MAG: hypothetical protein EBY16_09200 [Gammaproteobacteria bacterium]|nr:hypothetical protein [Gammaproteobacteria bacterium]